MNLLEMHQKNHGELEKILQEGREPKLEDLADKRFKGVNTPWYTRILGIKKFMKGFEWKDKDGKRLLEGYNIPVKQNGLSKPWIPKPSPEKPKRFGFFLVLPSSEHQSALYPNSVLLDYSQGENPWYEPAKLLRDYLVEVCPPPTPLYLGKAYLSMGIKIYVSYFILELESMD
ncbi:MAG: hypothetical protein D6785_12175 [Planctomycetota bacterium]|nr:MAG: hypothetical protein D6785_12175 [Planctomycetota bacterium]